MNEPLELTIAILDARPRGYPRDCVAALLRAGAFPAAELLLVGRRTAKLDEAAQLGEADGRFARVQRLDLDDEADAARAREEALSAARGEFVLLLFSDTFVADNCVAHLREVLARDPRAAAAGALLLRESGWPRPSRLKAPGLLQQLVQPRSLLALLEPRYMRYSRARPTAPPRRVAALYPACVLVRRAAHAEIGSYASGYHFGFEEVEWGLGAARRGWALYVAPAARAFFMAPQEKGAVPAAAWLAYETALLRCVRRTRGRAYAAAFRALRLWRSVRIVGVWSAVWLLSAGLSHLARHLLARHAALLRWRLRGCPPAGDAGDVESTRRWEQIL